MTKYMFGISLICVDFFLVILLGKTNLQWIFQKKVRIGLSSWLIAFDLIYADLSLGLFFSGMSLINTDISYSSLKTAANP